MDLGNRKRRAVRFWVLALMLAAGHGLIRGQQHRDIPSWVTYPGPEWKKLTPAQAGLDAAGFSLKILLNRLAQPSAGAYGGVAPDPQKWGAVLTRGGYLVHSWGNPDFRDQTASLGKVFTWVVAGLAVQEGLISLDDPIHRTWTGAGQLKHPHQHLDQGHHKSLTWRHLLEHQGGFPVTNAYHWRKRGGGTEWPVGRDFYVTLPQWAHWTGDPVHDNYAHVAPGSQRQYSSGGFWRLSQALTALWKRDLKDVLDQYLFQYMDLPSHRWDWFTGRELQQTPDWYPAMPGYGEFCDPPYEVEGRVVRGGPGWVVMSAKDLARFGLLIAAGGVWKGRQLIRPEFLPDLRSGVDLHLSTGDSTTFVAIGKVNTAGLPTLEDFNRLVVGPPHPPLSWFWQTSPWNFTAFLRPFQSR